MSYCRFGEADVYVYLDVGGYLNCCGCILPDEIDPFTRHYSTDSMVLHLRAHIRDGDEVPESVITELEADRQENDAFMLNVAEKAPSNQGEGER